MRGSCLLGLVTRPDAAGWSPLKWSVEPQSTRAGTKISHAATAALRASIVTIRCGDLCKPGDPASGYEDRYALARMDDHRRRTMGTNPLAKGDDAARYLAIENGVVIGREDVFAGELVVDGVAEPTTWGSSMVVPETLRGRGLGKLLAKAREEPSLRVISSNGVSKMLGPIYRKHGFMEFAAPRMLLLCRAHPLLELGRVPRAIRPLASPFANLAAGYFRWRVTRALPGREGRLVLVKCDAMDERHDREMQRVMSLSRVACHRSAAWINWLVRSYPVQHPKDHAQIMAIVRDGKQIGYTLINTRHFVRAKGISDFVLGSVRDWMVWDDANAAGDEQEAMVLAVQALIEMGVDGVEVCPFEASMARCLKRAGFLSHGNLRFFFKPLGDASPLAHEWCKRIESWRLRPAEGDHFFM